MTTVVSQPKPWVVERERRDGWNIVDRFLTVEQATAYARAWSWQRNAWHRARFVVAGVRMGEPMLEGEELRRVRLKWLTKQSLPLNTPMTCDNCEDNATCESAFDAYNTDGDCLESK